MVCCKGDEGDHLWVMRFKNPDDEGGMRCDLDGS